VVGSFWGTATDNSPVVVTLADGSAPSVLTVGKVWISEWISAPQEATAHYPDGPRTVPLHRPDRMVAGDRYKGDSGHADGWVRYGEPVRHQHSDGTISN
jgi:hypothetical protein